MENSISDCWRDADDSNLADPLGTERVEFIVLFDKDDVDVVYISIHGHVIVCEVVSHEAPEPMVDHALLVQGHPDPSYNGAKDLAAGSLRIKYLSRGESADDTWDMNSSQVLIHRHFSEYRGMCPMSILLSFLAALGRTFCLQSFQLGMSHRIAERHCPGMVGP